MEKDSLDFIYKEAIITASKHYENFPVVSLFIPKNLRKHVAVVYIFARQADDLADEGEFAPEQRLTNLEDYENVFNNALNGIYNNYFWNALHLTIQDKKLNPDDFRNLIKAFKQDIVKKRYKDYDEVLCYCKNSANPVGRIILDIFDLKNQVLKEYSDKICTALQLTNFYQDISVDYKKGRIYIPLEELSLFNLNEGIFVQKENNEDFSALMEYQIKRTEELFVQGSELIHHLPNPFKTEIKWTVLGGCKILEKIRKINYDVLNQRPILTKLNYFSLMLKAIVKG